MRPHVGPPPSLLVPATLHGRRAARRVPASAPRTHPVTKSHLPLPLRQIQPGNSQKMRCTPRSPLGPHPKTNCPSAFVTLCRSGREGRRWRTDTAPSRWPCGGGGGAAAAQPAVVPVTGGGLRVCAPYAVRSRCGATADRHFHAFGNKTQIKSMASNEIIIYRAGCLSTSRDAGAGRHRRATARLTREASLTRARWTGLAIAPGALADLWTSIVVVEGAPCGAAFHASRHSVAVGGGREGPRPSVFTFDPSRLCR